MKTVARCSFVLITILYGSFYAVAKEALNRIDPVIFTLLEALVLLPVVLVLIIMNWRELNKVILQRGVLLGSWMCLAMLTTTVAEKFTDATNTAFFPSIGGVIAALITSIAFKRRVGKMAWGGALISLIGTCLIILMSGGGLTFRGDLIAFLGALFFTVYLFLIDHYYQDYHPQNEEGAFWLMLSIEHLVIALWMIFISLLFGDWQDFHPVFPKDIEIIIYVGMATMFVPTVLSHFMQRYIEPLESAFVSTLEPIWGALIAYLYLKEIVPLPVYLGGGLVVIGAIFNTRAGAGSLSSHRSSRLKRPLLQGYVAKTYVIWGFGYPILLLGAGAAFLTWLNGFPPQAIVSLYQQWPLLQNLVQQGKGSVVLILFLQSLCWAIAWGALVAIGFLLLHAPMQKLSQERQQEQASFRSSPSSLDLKRKYPSSQLAQKRDAEQTQAPVSPFIPRDNLERKYSSKVAQRRQVARAKRFGRWG